ncbi:MAG: 1-deoxy-D-xylulose-5-phosphate synthase [Prevotellaceae bacterium]|jgi:1-deoxy-D-xylulose-5-phosphate synthase|nr:1-deoxy-D-xylulose-5-phosphate synthase [Prevotellaceae bacterium]
MEEILSRINSPDDIRKFNLDELTQLCKELREFIIDKCSSNPGHFGASLGTVELTVALHYVFNTPHDKLLWDVGHQAYSHKIITGRREMFEFNRKYGGISGFPKMNESPYDAFGVGHASTAISAALGMAEAARLKGEKRSVIAVVGDGSLTGGLAFEGMNNAGGLSSDMLVVLNDNKMAIDPNVGGLTEYLAKITLSGKYNQLKRNVWDFLGENRLRKLIQRMGASVKSAVLSEGNFFESMGLRYFGPIDGHNVEFLIKTLERLKSIGGPKLLHVVTQKGKGYRPAEENQTEWHAPGRFDKDTGQRIIVKADTTRPARYQDVFGETIIELAEQNSSILGITPAMPSGSSLNMMMSRMPERAFDVGIAEGHAVTFAAGLAAAGFTPFCNIYSSFMQRAYDNVIHDVALQGLKVVFCLDRGGIVGEDGPTHHGVYDLAYFRLVPGLTVAAPMNEIELRNMMFTAQLPDSGTYSIRYPRGNGVFDNWKQPFERIPKGKARVLREGNDLAVLSIGHVGNYAVEAIARAESEGISIMHCDMRFVKPLDEDLLHRIGAKFSRIITVEDGTIVGGLGGAVCEFFACNGYKVKVDRLGVPDAYIQQGTLRELHAECGFDVEGIYRKIKNSL